MRIIHLSPRDGDVALACPATLLLLAEAGHEVLDVCPEGGPGHRAACRAIGVQSVQGEHHRYLADAKWEILIAPSTRSIVREHEAAGRLAREQTSDSVWWQWSLQTSLDRPTLFVPFGSQTLNSLQANLHHFSGRDWRERLLRGRAEMIAALHRDTVKESFAEALTETERQSGHWRQGSLRTLNPEDPLA